MLELFKHYNIKHFNTCRWTFKKNLILETY